MADGSIRAQSLIPTFSVSSGFHNIPSTGNPCGMTIYRISYFEAPYETW
jgi:hypothetical protein